MPQNEPKLLVADPIWRIEVHMNQTLAIALGAVCGMVGAIPSGVLFERALKRGTKDSVSVEAGLASTMASFL